jgi:hypothetical protein
MFLIAIGFVTVFVLSYAMAARVGARRESVATGTVAGLVTFVVLLAAYLAALAFWVRSLLIEFINTRLPLLIDQLKVLVDQFPMLKEAI